MAITKLETTVNKQPIVFPRVEYTTTAIASSVIHYKDRVLPKGTYDFIVTEQGVGPASSDGSPAWLWFHSLETGKPIMSLLSGNQTQTSSTGPFTLAEDATFVLYGKNSASHMPAAVTFYPVDVPYSIEGRSTLLNVAATSTTTAFSTTTNLTTNFPYIGIGYDYDNNTVCYIQPTASSLISATVSYAVSAVKIHRLVAGATKYTKTDITFNSTNSHYIARSGSGTGYAVYPNDPKSRITTYFFIKNNELHVLSSQPIYNNGTTLSGWAKVDCATAGSKTWSLGNSDAAFTSPAATTLISDNSGSTRTYNLTHDTLSHKVISLGYHNTNGYATQWSAYWGQWDIATNTNDYTTSHGNRNRYLAGAASNVYGEAIDTFYPSASLGYAYAYGKATNSTPAMLNRSGSIYVSSAVPNKVYSNNTGTTAVNYIGGVSQINMASHLMFITPGNLFMGVSTAAYEFFISPDITSTANTTQTTLGNCNYTFTGSNYSVNKYANKGWGSPSGVSVNSTAVSGTSTAQHWSYYLVGSKLYLIHTTPTYTIQSSNYQANIMLHTYSMPATEDNIMRYATTLMGGYATPTFGLDAFN